MDIWHSVLWTYVWAFAGYCSIVIAWSSRREDKSPGSIDRASLGIVVPAYNEMTHIECIRAAIALAHSLSVPIVIVDDGSTDGSEAALRRLGLDTNACVVRHASNRGKAAALNTGFAALQTELVLTLDADTSLNSVELMTAFAAFSKPELGAVAFIIEGAESSRLARAQAMEYRYVHNFERLALAQVGLVFTVPGCASLWRRKAVVQVGGFRSRTCAEDTDATLALSLAGWKVEVARGVRAVTQCPLTVLALLRQRSRWIWGTIQAAAFALAHILLKRPAQNRLPATIFVALTMLNIFGFLIALGAAYRAATMQLGWSDILAGSLLVAVTVIRIILTRKKEGYVDTGVVKVLAMLAAMQVANITSFWCGLFTGRMIRFSW